MAKTKSFFANIPGRAVFVVLVLFLILYAALSTSITHKLEDERFTYRENFVWAVFQVQRQYLVLQRDIQAALATRDVTKESVEKIILGYELLVSRVFLLRDGEGFTVLHSVPEVADLIATLEKQITVIDDQIVVMSEPVELIRELGRLLEPLGDPLQEAVVRTTNFVSVYNTNNISAVKNDIALLTLSLIHI